MELRHLRYFLAVADAMSFTVAAKRLRVAQPALSQQVRSLERELGVTLLERGARTRGLTEAGQRFAVRARRLLLEAEGAAEEMAAFGGGRRGTVRFGSALQSLTEGRLAGILADFHRRNPGVRIAFREAHTGPLLDLLGRGRLELALIHVGGDLSPRPPADTHETVRIEPLYGEPLVLAVGPRHRWAKCKSVAWKDLEGEEVISFGPGSTVRQIVAAAARLAGIHPRTPISATNLGTVRALVSAGLGVAVLPEAALTLPGPPLHATRLVDPALTRVVSLARNVARFESPAARALADWLRERLPPRA